ncbi:MAG: SEL1-like repeat protein [Campylobacter sp.]|uniref:SEL1-like repeat protein n=1 Tax=Campylobacter sp. TaxID=205 RepID=UPI002A57F66C|nr:SEL1-like repeat protein [Campylobacter sp.]MCI6178867.1 SEL1-like repeat protein [Campylobacter sp.]MCI7102699.1 SEL1-like repeat protein [Campylobacter sp.]MDD7091111.1 SEL1-like repeat protein [Campylobacteraceae bacterium]MDY5285760.1 SEL1-like repeat protein [Campylobacter sp.]
MQKCRDGLGLACDYGASRGTIRDDIDFELTQRACDSDYSSNHKPHYCSEVAYAYRNGNIVKEDTDKTLEYAKKACELGRRNWCEFLYDVYSGNRTKFEKYKNPAEAEKYKEKIK